MLKLNSVIISSEDPKPLVDFYTKILGKPGWEGGDFKGWDVGGGWLTVGPHDQIHGKAKEPSRVMFFFETKDVKGEFERMKGEGAEVVAEPYEPEEAEGMMLATLADPDGNYFQLATPMEM